MSFQNSHRRYGGIAKTFHWTIALGILAVIPLGMIANDLAHAIRDPAIPVTESDLSRAALLFSLHKTIGVTIFFVALLRILWAITQPKPAPLHPERRLETFAAETVHWLLYGALVLVPLTGWIHHAAAAGFAPIWWPFGQTLPLVPQDAALAETFATLHGLFEKVLLVALALHIAGAVKHQVIDKDATLRRMLPGRPDLPDLARAPHGVLPPLAALVVWGAALGVGLSATSSEQDNAPRLEAAASDWQVSDGSLSIGITQLGSAVTGEFTDWTAAITFDPRDTPGPAGSVEVTINIGSLTLGTVSAQAMGPDFFDAERFPTATFTGQIERTADGYTATGPLTIKGTSQDLTLPFDLVLSEGTATAQGAALVKRLDFGVGQSMPTADSLGFDVEIRFDLTASRAQ